MNWNTCCLHGMLPTESHGISIKGADENNCPLYNVYCVVLVSVSQLKKYLCSLFSVSFEYWTPAGLYLIFNSEANKGPLFLHCRRQGRGHCPPSPSHWCRRLAGRSVSGSGPNTPLLPLMPRDWSLRRGYFSIKYINFPWSHSNNTNKGPVQSPSTTVCWLGFSTANAVPVPQCPGKLISEPVGCLAVGSTLHNSHL